MSMMSSHDPARGSSGGEKGNRKTQESGTKQQNMVVWMMVVDMREQSSFMASQKVK
jgi:hypothetical protein